MAHLIFRCDQTRRVIATGIELDRAVLEGLQNWRYMQCQFCGKRHGWEIVDRAPASAKLFSLKSEECLARSVQSELSALLTWNPAIRALHERMAQQWYRLALEHEWKADELR